MMIKRSLLSGMGPDGSPLQHIINPGDGAPTSPDLLPDVAAFIKNLRPSPKYTYVLTNAMGYSEYFGPNSNADWYGLNRHMDDFNGLLHHPPDWGQDYEIDRARGKFWPHGFPSFYGATAYAHHKNSDPEKYGFGEIIYVATNDKMKRIELVKKIDNAQIQAKGRGNILDRIRHGERVDTSMGAKVPFDLCHAPGTLVRTPRGYRSIEEIEVGDFVISHLNKKRKVTRTFVRDTEEDEVLQIEPLGSPNLLASRAHPLLVVRRAQVRSEGGRRYNDLADRTFTPEWVAAEDVRVGDYLLAPIPKEGTRVEERARILGYYLGDGHIIKQRTGKRKNGPYRDMGVGLSVGLHEPDHRDWVVQELSDLAANKPSVYAAGAGRKAEQIHCYDQGLAAWVLKHGGRGSRGKFVHEDVFTWDRASRLNVLGGWIDTDGCVDEFSVRGTTVSRGLALDMRRLAHSLGIPASITAGKYTSGFTGQKGTAYWLCIGRGTLAAVCPEFREYSMKLQMAEPTEKASSCSIHRLGDYFGFAVRSISTDHNTTKLHNISVETDESYIAEGLASHNCSVCTDWQKIRAARKTYDPQKHLHEMIAVLRYHKMVSPIRGLSITPRDYCSCMKNSKGKILPSGEKVFVYNDAPRFFDNSFVWVGADRTARVMWHLAGLDPLTPADRTARAQGPTVTIKDRTIIIKSAMEKVAGEPIKLSEKEKHAPGGTARMVHLRSFTEPDISPDILDRSAKIHGVQRLLSTLSALGMVLKPGEFQEIVMGSQPSQSFFQDRARAKNVTFDPNTDAIDDTYAVSGSGVTKEASVPFLPYLEQRSSFAPYLDERSKVAAKLRRNAPQTLRTPLLDKIAAQYNGYRLSILETAPATFSQHYDLVGVPADQLLKVSSAGMGSLLLGLAPMVHLLSSHLRAKKRSGEDLGTVGSFIESNPSFTRALTIGAGLRAAMGIIEGGGIGAVAGKALGAIAGTVTQDGGILRALGNVAQAM